MITRRSRSVLVAAATLACCLATTSPATAENVPRCQRSLTKESQKLLAARSKALASCEDRKVAGSLPPSTVCRTESSTTFAIAKATAKARAAMVKGCCGQDRVCGNAGDELLSSIGWGSTTQCPGFESGQNGNCTNGIAHPGDVADCLLCVGSAATDQLIDLLYRNLTPSADTVVKRCQRTIGKATTKFYQTKSRVLEKCWEKRIKGSHTNDCPAPGDDKAVGQIAKA
ncbi:MAG: hypothetical protein ABIR79_25580, partial [Candidatus Binatia bacterium]